MSSTLKRSLRLRAALCYLAGLVWLFFIPLGFGAIAFLRILTNAQWVFQLVMFVSTLVMVFSVLPVTYWVWRVQRHVHPFVDQHGRKALKLQQVIAGFLLLLFLLTTILVIPACSQVAHNYTSPRDQYIFSWVAGWILLEAVVSLLILAPINLVAALLAYLGKQDF